MVSSSRWAVLIGVVFVMVAGSVAVSPASAGPVSGVGSGLDFDGDGADDLVIGTPYEDIFNYINRKTDAGKVTVVQGRSENNRAAFTFNGSADWHQGSAGVEGQVEDGDLFGGAVAVGDFDGQLGPDLAIGSPGEAIGSRTRAGAINVLYNSGSGLSSSAGRADQILHQNSAGIVEGSEPGDQFGSSLAAGDFNNDGYDDVAIGVPAEAVAGVQEAGAVHIIYGSSSGLTAANDAVFRLKAGSGMQGTSVVGDRFGAALATGDLNGDGWDDLVVGIPGKTVYGVEGAGAISILFGSSSGITTNGNMLVSQSTPGVISVSEAGENMGAVVAVGDLNGDGLDDVAVGVPHEDLGGKTDVGAVHTFYGHAADGVTMAVPAGSNQIWHQGTTAVPGSNEAGDLFGSALVIADFSRDGFADLAIGSPGEAIGTTDNAGAVTVIYGSSNGATPAQATEADFWAQSTAEIADHAQRGDRFGASLGAGDYNGDGAADLAIGVPNESLTVSGAGGVAVLLGTQWGLDDPGNEFITQAPTKPGQHWFTDRIITDPAHPFAGRQEFGDRFGSILSSQCGPSGCDQLAPAPPQNVNITVRLSESGDQFIQLAWSSHLAVTAHEVRWTSSGDTSFNETSYVPSSRLNTSVLGRDVPAGEVCAQIIAMRPGRALSVPDEVCFYWGGATSFSSIPDAETEPTGEGDSPAPAWLGGSLRLDNKNFTSSTTFDATLEWSKSKNPPKAFHATQDFAHYEVYVNDMASPLTTVSGMELRLTELAYDIQHEIGVRIVDTSGNKSAMLTATVLISSGDREVHMQQVGIEGSSEIAGSTTLSSPPGVAVPLDICSNNPCVEGPPPAQGPASCLAITDGGECFVLVDTNADGTCPEGTAPDVATNKCRFKVAHSPGELTCAEPYKLYDDVRCVLPVTKVISDTPWSDGVPQNICTIGPCIEGPAPTQGPASCSGLDFSGICYQLVDANPDGSCEAGTYPNPDNDQCLVQIPLSPTKVCPSPFFLYDQDTRCVLPQ